jgi:hypothetical protein
MINENYIYLAAALTVLGNAYYAYSIIKNTTKPSLITWLLWIVIPIVTFFAQQSQGGSIQSMLSLAVGLSPLLIIICALIKKHFILEFTRTNIACLAISSIAILLWMVSGNENIAIILSIVAGLVAGIPTLIHGYNHPTEENTSPFMLGIVAAAITLLTLDSFSMNTAAFASYLFISNSILTLTIYFSKKHHLNTQPVLSA